MHSLNILRLLLHHEWLQRRRSAASGLRRLLSFAVLAADAALLTLLGLSFPRAVHDWMPNLSVELFWLLPAVDIVLRLCLQRSPSLLWRPYRLLPVPRRCLAAFFVVRTLFSGYNAMWIFFLVPYALTAVLPAEGFGACLLCVAGGMGVILADALLCQATRLALNYQLSIINYQLSLFPYETPLRLRNRRLRLSLWATLFTAMLLSLSLAAGDRSLMWTDDALLCFLCYAVPGTLLLTGVPGHELNFIGALALRRGALSAVLCEKYRFCTALLLVPFVLLLPSVALGRITLLQSLSSLLLTAGVLYPLLFLPAPFVRRALPLEERLSGGTSSLTPLSGPLLVALPLLMERLSTARCGDAAPAVMALASLPGLVLHPLWIKYIAFAVQRRLMVKG
ncbi:MAG: hypothetical protein IKP30_07090 [Bacteroidaceae bacterium]|nr:hypothetical protein [Bacteroidaceae bacterium]